MYYVQCVCRTSYIMCVVYNVHCTKFTVYTVYNVHLYSVYTVQYSYMYLVHCMYLVYCTIYSQTSIIRGTWAYKILVSKTVDNRGPRIIEVLLHFI